MICSGVQAAFFLVSSLKPISYMQPTSIETTVLLGIGHAQPSTFISSNPTCINSSVGCTIVGLPSDATGSSHVLYHSTRLLKRVMLKLSGLHVCTMYEDERSEKDDIDEIMS